jgi:Flp pilus assembly protein TadD
MRDFDRASSEYKLAMLGGLASAYNNLARLYILDKNYAAAVPSFLLKKKLELSKDLRISIRS